MKTKILHIYKSYYPHTLGGVEKHIYSLTESLYGHNIESAILTTTHKKEISVEKVGKSWVYYFPAVLEIASCPFSLSFLKNFQAIANQYDILHVHFPWPFADLVLTLHPIKKPIVVFYHSDIVRQKWLKFLYQPLMHRFLNNADLILTSSENYLNSSPTLEKYKYKTTVLPYGLDIQTYPIVNDTDIEQWRQRVGSNFFLFVGVFRYYKGLRFLLEAIKDTQISVVLAGRGPEELHLKKMKIENNLEKVNFVGEISEKDKIALHQLCKATIAPSHLRAEAFCLSILESLMLGKPIISTELNTGTSFVNQHGVSGLVVPPGDPQALKNAMLLMLNDHDLYEKLKQGTQVHYLKYFTVEKMRAKYLEVYKSFS